MQYIIVGVFVPQDNKYVGIDLVHVWICNHRFTK